MAERPEGPPSGDGASPEGSGGGLPGDLGRLRLEPMLRDLVERTGQVLDSESRLHRLLAAVVAVGSDLSLSEVLRRIVESSCDLVGARYGALTVVGEDRDRTLAECAGAGPGGRPRRVGGARAGGARNRSARESLAVPVRVRGTVFGTLRLTGKQGGGGFTDEDADVVGALAAAAGVAVDNARLYEEARRREAWLRASTDITAALLAGGTPRAALRLVAQRAREVTGARFTAIALPGADPGELVLDVVDRDGGGGGGAGIVGRSGGAGGGAPGPTRRRVPVEHSVCGQVFRSGVARVLDGSADGPCGWDGPVGARADPDGQARPMLLLPLSAGRHVLGVLVVANPPGGPQFRTEDLHMAETFAGHAALAVEFSRAQVDRQRLAVYEDRDRIARDLHDLVIQRLFAIGLGLQGTSRLVARPDVAERVAGFVGDLDATIGEIRRTIFSLQAPDGGSASLRAAVVGACAEAAAALGFEPHLRMRGPLDLAVPHALHPHVVATLREALSNVARHAGAGAVEVVVEADTDTSTLGLVVSDDGGGIPSSPRHRSGLDNIARRARNLGGQVRIESAPGTGTTLTWSVPLGP